MQSIISRTKNIIPSTKAALRLVLQQQGIYKGNKQVN